MPKQAILRCDKTDKTKAEIYWTFNVVANNYSLNSCDDSNSLFTMMFPDVINFGLEPYFRNMLIYDVNTSPFFSISFDESLNECFQNCQMDVILQYFNEKKNEADVQYFDSKFLGHPNAKNLLASLNQSIEKLCPNKLIQLAMDGPATNWALFDLLCTQRELEGNPTLMNVGSCGLHVIHGALKTGVQAIKWNICKLLRACYTLFHDSPAR